MRQQLENNRSVSDSKWPFAGSRCSRPFNHRREGLRRGSVGGASNKSVQHNAPPGAWASVVAGPAHLELSLFCALIDLLFACFSSAVFDSRRHGQCSDKGPFHHSGQGSLASPGKLDAAGRMRTAEAVQALQWPMIKKPAA
jgi:hypothetical protein